MVLGQSPDFFHLFGDIGECLLEALSNFTILQNFFYSFGDIGECCLEALSNFTVLKFKYLVSDRIKTY